MDYIIDSITLYTVENGSLTCVTTIVSLVCWLTMSHNLIFLGLHFAISKLYANSFLATLNARKALMTRSQGSSDRGEHALPVLFPDTFRTRADRSLFNSQHVADPTGTKLHINVVKTVDVGGEPSNAYAPSDLAPDESDDVAKIDRA
ncbi:hypothetical protein AcV5_005388 [Taiwanofungus camphoratus]|nr:hypothetical protein AcW2_000006 [Antrodia cinnamomea]KAI0937487.1 hypothetical protein AcV5_005388 [Antrodia cinnamomea]KAI0962696.1 hypothetical protein AcV7_001485 [Antrodia cinnamomea]